jgi:hypothetical protein
MRTLVIGFRAHPDTHELFHFKTLNLITYAKILFPNKVTLTGSGGLYVDTYTLEDTIQPTVAGFRKTSKEW